jgi:isoquinoline 1-oxidoreductase beta subunit
MDVVVPNALPTMVCRPPTINGKVVAVGNLAAVKAMPGVTDVVTIPTGVAVRAQTFGQCIDAVRALQVTWGPGTAEGASDASVRAELARAELPMTIPTLPLLARTIDKRFSFAFASNSPLETNNAVADVRAGRAEIWSSLKTPIVAKQHIAAALGLPVASVTCHVVEGGGSFGRHLFHDAALEAALASQKIGKPVRLMWHRTDDFRQGRMHPMSTTRIRTSYLGSSVLSFEVRHTSVATDLSHGLGEALTSVIASTPAGGTLFSQFFFELSQTMPYDVGATGMLLNEVDPGFNTGSMRNVYSPNVTTARELMIDELARGMRKDPLALRRQLLSDTATRAVLDRVASVGQWGRAMAPGTAQGIALHTEYKSRAAVLVEIDCRPATVARPVRDGFTGPRVTKVVAAVDAGLPINPRGIEAQIQGGVMDGIGLALTFSIHLQGGHSLEGSWDNTFYTRQWNVPASCDVIVMPSTTGVPGGIGELGVAPSMAAVACAYARATGTLPTSFPINHDRADLGFAPLPTVPSIPQSRTDGLA